MGEKGTAPIATLVDLEIGEELSPDSVVLSLEEASFSSSVSLSSGWDSSVVSALADESELVCTCS